MEEEREYVELTGVLDVSTELCIDGSEALALVTDDGDEYVINNRKTVKRLFKYAYNMSRLICTGYLEHDPTGIDIFSVVSFVEDETPQNIPTPKKAAPKKAAEKKASPKKAEEKHTEPKKAEKKAAAKKKSSAKKSTPKKPAKKSAKAAFEETFDEYEDDDVNDFNESEEQEF